MARVDFYILDDQDESRRLHYLCRLVDKAWRLGHRIWIHTPSAAHAESLDALLWTFSQGSFVPHERAIGDWDPNCPVVIGDRPAETDERHLLVNEGQELPAWTEHFGRIAEIVNQEPATRAAGRARYTRHRDAGHDLHHHRVD